MRPNIFRMAIVMVVGSFFVYCGTNGTSVHNDAFVADAHADSSTCCTPPAQSFVKLAEGDVSSTTLKSPDISVGAYREIVIYSNRSDQCALPTYRADASSPFGFTSNGGMGRQQVQGTALQLVFLSSLCNGSMHYVVAGVQ